MKKNTVKPKVTQRRAQPRLSQEENKIVILCPFCTPSHALIPGRASPCGTILDVQAVQLVFKAKYSDLVCVKCGGGGGDMVKYQNAFVHLEDCSPGVVTLAEPPEYSKIAGIIYKLPKWAKSIIEKYSGTVMNVDEVSPDGKRTGVTLGYFFVKGKSDA